MDSTSRFILNPLIVLSAVLSVLPSITHAARELTDQKIGRRLSSKMENSHLFTTPPHAACTSGVVTLSGTVADLRLNDQAVMLAEGTRGVQAVIDDLKIASVAQSDGDIWKDTIRAIQLDPTLRPYYIVPSVHDGIVTLTGRVDSLAESSLASWTVSGVTGVLGIVNNIEIVPRKTSDREITNEVRDELKADPFVGDANLSVATKKGVVTLSGEIPSLIQRRRIYRDALVSGVVGLDLTGVKVNLQLPNLGPRLRAPESDVQIQTAAAAAIRLDPRLRHEKIAIDVNGGRATLSGTVQSLRSQMIADEDVRNTAGVAVVDDRLIVNSKKIRPDSKILADINDMFNMDSLLTPFSISAQVKNGIVTLTGKVNSDYEKWDASEEVALIDGVRKIDNELGLFHPRPAVSNEIYSFQWAGEGTDSSKITGPKPTPKK